MHPAFLFAVLCHRRPTFVSLPLLSPLGEKEESSCEQKAMLTQRLRCCNVNLRQVASVLGQLQAFAVSLLANDRIGALLVGWRTKSESAAADFIAKFLQNSQYTN